MCVCVCVHGTSHICIYACTSHTWMYAYILTQRVFFFFFMWGWERECVRLTHISWYPVFSPRVPSNVLGDRVEENEHRVSKCLLSIRHV